MKTDNLLKLYESYNSTIYKGKYQDYNKDVIIKVLNSGHPTDEQITRFNNEYKFTKDIEISGVRNALNIDILNGKNILILEYFEGSTLRNLIKKNNIDIKSLLKGACNISQALGEIHQHNIIHKDINSNNILVNENNEIKIIDFGFSTKYNLKSQNLFNPKHLEGTIPYISPEQTGRMNRSVDYRTDLYSFGVVLYELFTGQLPFTDVDDMELIHSHIAKIPVPPIEINSEIPKVLSDIILKLLSKNAEDRYQSAFGLKHDLEYCLTNLSGLKDLTDFKIGGNDYSGRLTIPEKLYGRENETEKLFEIYKNVNQGRTELLLISGAAGVGKSALIHEIHKPLTEKRGFYIEGKFDQLQKNIPYFAIIQAFTDFAHFILKESDEELNYWRKLIQKAVGNIGTVLINLIPDLELIIGKQPELPKLDGKEAQNRFNYVWSNFLKAISKAKHPLVIFIDDLQWADNSSVKLLKTLLNDKEIKYLFCIIAYRDNEIDKADLQSFESLNELKISNIKLENLNQEDVNSLISDTLNIKISKYSEILSNLIYSKTLGNAFFTVQFLKNLYEEEFLKFDFNENIWKWDFEEIENQNITDNVVELMANKVQKLPKETQEILKIAACIGNRFDLKILSIIYKKDEEACKIDLEAAIIENLIFPIDNLNLKFTHDRIQQAVYTTIPEEEKNNFHLQTGRLLLKFLSNKNLEKRIFDVVNQLNFGEDLIEKEEKKQLAELNIQAALKAKSSSAYLPAYNYLKTSCNSLEQNSWKTDYEFTLKVYDELTELSYLTAFYNETEKYTEIINKNVKTILDKTNAYFSLINAYRAQSLFTEAMQTGLKVLSELGINFPKKPSLFHILFNLIKVSISLKRIGLEKYMELPLVDKKLRKAQFILIDAIGSSAFFTSKNLVPLLVFKFIKLTIKSGHCLSSPYIISAYGLILGTLNKIEQANKFGKIAIKIIVKYNLNQIICRTNFINFCIINVWKVKLTKIKKNISKNHKIGLESGDFEFASYSLYHSFCYSFYCDTNLKKIKKGLLENYNHIEKLSQKITLNEIQNLLQITDNLINEDFSKAHLIAGKYFNEDKEMPLLMEDKNVYTIAHFYLMKILLIYVLLCTQDIEKLIEKLLEYKEGNKGYYFYALVNFYISLCSLTIIDNKNKKQRKKLLKRVKNNQRQMKIWAKHCPENFQNKYDLVEAERYRVIRKNEIAKYYYDKAIKGANNNKFLSEEAISWEAAGRFYLQLNNKTLAKTYLQNAYKTYKIWGATAKLKQLKDKYPEFISERENIKSTLEVSTISSGNSTNITETSHFDLTSIVKAGQSLSGEVKLENLLKSMLMIIMENAGATHALIIINDNKKFTIEAEHNIKEKETTVLQGENIENSEKLPQSIIKYVIRAQKAIVLNNATEDQTYNTDEYIKLHKSKSVLCQPIIHKSKLTAVLYLENNVSTDAFTPERLDVINMLSSQIAISIENALLYDNLEQKVKVRTAKVVEQNKAIKSSINYAKTIQNAILPFKASIDEHIETFILYRPKDIVSGDFYWFTHVPAKNGYSAKTFIAAIDCTGHGVPGAFMSMIGTQLLNKIVNEDKITNPAEILSQLHEGVITSLKQKETNNTDGMDVCFCRIEQAEDTKLIFSGAKRDLIYYNASNKSIELIKGERKSIGGNVSIRRMSEFKNNELILSKGDILYLTTDGFVDQNNISRGRIGNKRFIKLLEDNLDNPLNVQKEIFERVLDVWQKGTKQRDDITVIGVKIKK